LWTVFQSQLRSADLEIIQEIVSFLTLPTSQAKYNPAYHKLKNQKKMSLTKQSRQVKDMPKSKAIRPKTQPNLRIPGEAGEEIEIELPFDL